MDVEVAVLLGAFVGRVPHSRAVPVVGVASDLGLLRGEDLGQGLGGRNNFV